MGIFLSKIIKKLIFFICSEPAHSKNNKNFSNNDSNNSKFLKRDNLAKTNLTNCKLKNRTASEDKAKTQDSEDHNHVTSTKTENHLLENQLKSQKLLSESNLDNITLDQNFSSLSEFTEFACEKLDTVDRSIKNTIQGNRKNH